MGSEDRSPSERNILIIWLSCFVCSSQGSNLWPCTVGQSRLAKAQFWVGWGQGSAGCMISSCVIFVVQIATLKNKTTPIKEVVLDQSSNLVRREGY